MPKIPNREDKEDKTTTQNPTISMDRIPIHDSPVSDQRELLRQQRLAVLGKLVATMAHKIGTPLTAISGHLQLLMEDPTLTPNVRQRLQTVWNQTNRLNSAMRDLLDFSRPPVLRFEPISIVHCLDQTAQLFHPIFEKHRIVYTKNIEPSLPLVWGDSARLQEALATIIENAVDAMPDGGNLTVNAWERHAHDSGGQAPMVCVEIQDTGVGIPSHLLPRVIEPFFTTKDIGEGTGLGLAITSEIIQLHHGRLKITSSKNHGSRVALKIPIWRE